MGDLQRKQGRGAQTIARKPEGAASTTLGARPVMGQKPGDPLLAERKAAALQIQRSVNAWANRDGGAEREEKGAAPDEEPEAAAASVEAERGEDEGATDDAKPDEEKADAKSDETAEDDAPDADDKGDAQPDADDKGEAKPDEEKADAKSDETADAKPDADDKAEAKPEAKPDEEKADAKSDETADAKPDAGDKGEAKPDAKPDTTDADAKGEGTAAAATDMPSGQKKRDDDPPKRVSAAEVKRKLFRTPTPGAAAAAAPAAAAPQPTKDAGPPPVNPTEQKPAAPEGGADAPRPAAVVERVDTAAAMGVSGPPPDRTPPLQAPPGPTMQKLPEGVTERFNRSAAEAPVAETRDMKPDMDKVTAEEAAVAPEETKFKAGQGPSAAYGQASPPEAKAAIAPSREPPPLPADGILGVVAAGNFIAAAAAIGANWASYKGADSGAQRAAAYMTAVNAQLTGPGEVGPPVNHVPQKMGAGAYGHMDSAAWALVLNTDMFEDKANVREAPTPANATPRDDLAQTATGVYHEARHAEQWHKMARTRAGQFKESPAQIQTAMPNMNADAIADAAGKKLGTPEAPTDPRFLAWFESVYDPVKGAERSNILNQWRATLATRTTAGEQYKRAYEEADTKGKAKNAKGQEWTTQKGVVDPLFATYTPLQQAYDQKKTAYDAKEVERNAAAQTWRDKKQARDALIPPGQQAQAQRLTAWNTLQAAKQTETTAKTTRDQADADRVAKQQAHARTMATYTQKEQAYQPLWDAYQRAQNDVAAYNAARSFSEQQYQPARDAANGTWAAVTAAETKLQADHAAYVAAQTTATTAENDWKTADAAFQAALTAYNAAETAFGAADVVWRRVDGEFQTLTREAQAAWQAAKTAYDTYKAEQDKLDQILTAYRTLETEFNALFTTWQTVKTAWETADAAWKPWDQKYHALPEEVDAYRTEQIIGIEYRSRYPAR